MAFRALIVRKDDDAASAAVEYITHNQLLEGNVIVAVEYSTLNYKDGLCLGSGGGLVRRYPHVPGIDFAGMVKNSDHANFAPGDRVVLTGWGVGQSARGRLRPTSPRQGASG